MVNYLLALSLAAMFPHAHLVEVGVIPGYYADVEEDSKDLKGFLDAASIRSKLSERLGDVTTATIYTFFPKDFYRKRVEITVETFAASCSHGTVFFPDPVPGETGFNESRSPDESVSVPAKRWYDEQGKLEKDRNSEEVPHIWTTELLETSAGWAQPFFEKLCDKKRQRIVTVFPQAKLQIAGLNTRREDGREIVWTSYTDQASIRTQPNDTYGDITTITVYRAYHQPQGGAQPYRFDSQDFAFSCTYGSRLASRDGTETAATRFDEQGTVVQSGFFDPKKLTRQLYPREEPITVEDINEYSMRACDHFSRSH